MKGNGKTTRSTGTDPELGPMDLPTLGNLNSIKFKEKVGFNSFLKLTHQGKYIFKDGNIYAGSFKNNKKHGLGKY